MDFFQNTCTCFQNQNKVKLSLSFKQLLGIKQRLILVFHKLFNEETDKKIENKPMSHLFSFFFQGIQAQQLDTVSYQSLHTMKYLITESKYTYYFIGRSWDYVTNMWNIIKESPNLNECFELIKAIFE